MIGGYAGKILLIDLTQKWVSSIDTEQYVDWGGGHGIGSAIFWDICRDKTIEGFDPRNVLTIMTSPLSGTLAPGVAGRCEVQGIGVQAYPIGWFTRSNFGGRFSGMLKAAGWDGIVIKGASDTPVWINIINDKVTFEDAGKLWGLDTWETQLQVWKMVTGQLEVKNWQELNDERTTQRPAVLCIGPAGENLSRSASLIHETGHGAGQGGFGGIWGSKKLKAISVLGTGSIKISNPRVLMDARLWFTRNYSFHKEEQKGASGCLGCPKLCQARNLKYGKGSSCGDLFWYALDIDNIQKGPPEVSLQAADLAQRYGVNVCDLMGYLQKSSKGGYLIKLHQMGVLGPGKVIDSNPLPFDRIGSYEFAEALVKAISYRQGIGNDLAEGPSRAAEKWGRLKEDLSSGILALSQWGYTWHWSLPGVEWIFGSILSDRDIDEHDFETDGPMGIKFYPEDLDPEQLVELIASKTIPYTGDPLMFNYSWQGADGSNMKDAMENGIYSRHKAKLVAWHRHYTRFWKQSVQYCDWVYPSFTSEHKPHHSGFTPEAEPKFYNAVTGKELSFAEGMEVGRRIWNLDRAIWILQGRHRNMENPAEFLFKPGAACPKPLPVYQNGRWYLDVPLENMFLDKNGVETFKTRYYELEGWDPETGWPNRDTLEELGLRKVADELEKMGRLGKT